MRTYVDQPLSRFSKVGSLGPSLSAIAFVLILGLAPRPALAAISQVCATALSEMQTGLSGISYPLGSSSESINAPSISVEEREQRTEAYCSSSDREEVVALIEDVLEACASDSDTGALLDLEGVRSFLTYLELPCVAVQGEFCGPAYWDLFLGPVPFGSEPLTQEDLATFCSPCIRKMFAFQFADSGSADALFAAFDQNCVRHEGEYCMPGFQELTQNPPADQEALLNGICEVCNLKVLRALERSGAATFASNFCDRNPTSGGLCVLESLPSLESIPDADQFVDCVPGSGSTCGVTGSSCTGHDACLDRCALSSTCEGGTSDGLSCAASIDCSEVCDRTTSTCSVTGGACDVDSDCPERAIPCSRRCTETGTICTGDVDCAGSANACSQSVCGTGTLQDCATDAECSNGPCWGGFCYDTSSAEACSVTADCSAATPETPSIDGVLSDLVAELGCCGTSALYAVYGSNPSVLWLVERADLPAPCASSALLGVNLAIDNSQANLFLSQVTCLQEARGDAAKIAACGTPVYLEP